MKKDGRLFLIHIAACLARIAEYTAGGEEEFLSDLKTQDAVLRNLQTLAESTQRLSEEFKNAHASTDWRGVAGFRNVLVHEYLGISLRRVWAVVEQHLPTFRQEIEEALKAGRHTGPPRRWRDGLGFRWAFESKD